MKPKKVIPKIAEEEVDSTFELIAEEITEYLIEKNLELMNLIKEEKYEECTVIREALITFINETSTILNKATNIRRQTLYQHFHNQSDYIREMMFEKYKNK